MAGSLVDYVVAGILVGAIGLLLEMQARKPCAIGYRAAAIAGGVAAIVFGNADDAPA